MKGFILLCARRPVTVIMSLCAILLAGAGSVPSLPLGRLPEIPSSRVIVETAYYGMSAEDVRALVTIPVEDALSPVKGLERVRSVSRSGVSLITLDFVPGTDAAASAALVREAVDSVYAALPEGAEKPAVSASAEDRDALLVVAVSSRRRDSVFERRFADYELRSRLRGLEGIGAIVLSGGRVAEARVELDREKITARRVDPVRLAGVIAAETRDMPAGIVRDGERELSVISAGSLRESAELSSLTLAAGEVPLVLGDVARVSEGVARQKSIFAASGKEMTALEIFRRPGANPARLSEDVRRVAADVNERFSRDVEVLIVSDGSPEIVAGLQNLAIAMLFSAAAVIAVLFFFIRALRRALLASLSIVVSASAALAVLALAGRSLNSMSLSGLSLGLGLVSDASVIILDALSSGNSGEETAGTEKTPEEVAEIAASLSGSGFGGAATTAVVFVPVFFLPGALGRLFGDLALTLVASVTAGWLYAQFALPSLFAASGPGGKNTAKKSALTGVYQKLLRAAFDRPALTLAVACVLSVAGTALTVLRPAVFVNSEAAREILVEAVFPSGTRPEVMAERAAVLTGELSKLDCLSSVFAMAGAEDEAPGRRAEPGYADEKLSVRAVLAPGAESESALDRVRGLIERQSSPGGASLPAELRAGYQPDRTAELLGLNGASVFAVRGRDTKETFRAAASAKELLAASGIGAEMSPAGRREEIRFRPERRRVALLGLDSANIARQTMLATEGVNAGSIETPSHPVDIRVIAPSRVTEVYIPLESGAARLDGIGTFSRESVPGETARLDRSDVLYLTTDRPVPEPLAVRAALVRTDESAFSRYKNTLVITILLVLCLLYLTLGAQFESFVLPLIFLLSVPFALAGTGPALALSGIAFDSGSALALVALFGIVVNNGIVLYETAVQRAALGESGVEAAFGGALARFRAVLATTLTTVIVLFPSAFTPLGAAQRSVSLTMLGGCVASTFLTLFALPVIFSRFLKNKEIKKNRPNGGTLKEIDTALRGFK